MSKVKEFTMEMERLTDAARVVVQNMTGLTTARMGINLLYQITDNLAVIKFTSPKDVVTITDFRSAYEAPLSHGEPCEGRR